MEEHDLWLTRAERSKQLTRESKQHALDQFRNGKSIGEIMREMKWDLGLTCAVINENIETAFFVRDEAK